MALDILIQDARTVLAALERAAEQNAALPVAPIGNRPARRTGDRLTEYYFVTAAAAARGLPAQRAAGAYLLGLAVGLDDADLLRRNPLTALIWRRVESEAERARRIKVLGAPTMRQRRDWTQHFVVSGGLVVCAGARLAELAGVQKEVSDAHGGSGFSFGDLSADLAGVAFAVRLQAAPAFPPFLEQTFAVEDFLPPAADLVEDLQWPEFTARYGSLSDERYRKALQEVRNRVAKLPGLKRITP